MNNTDYLKNISFSVWKTNNIDNNETNIYEIVNFHMKQKNLDFNSKRHKIEFSLKNEFNEFKIEYDKKNKKNPLFSIIHFLTDEINPIVFTEIDLESYKYKEIKNENKFICFQPIQNTQIVFDSSKYYGFYKLINNENNGKFLLINIWDSDSNSILNLNDKESNSIVIEKFDNEIIFENIFYDNIINLFLYEEYNKIDVLDNILTKNKNSLIILNNNTKNFINISSLEEKYGEIASEIYPFINKNMYSNIDKNNRFNTNKIFQNSLSKDVCYWIINECEKLENWESTKYDNYNNYLNVEKIPSVLNFLLFVSRYWLFEIQKIYDCKNINLNISDIFVSKYTKTRTNENFNTDKSFLTLNIYLNDEIDYIDGEMLFSDNNEKIKIYQGDIIIYNGKKLRTCGNVSDGVKYVLVLFLDII